MMTRCIALAMRSADLGEYPYAAVICRNGNVVCESTNAVVRDHDVTHHSEVVAMSEAQHRLGSVSLDDCTLYANAEPCALCCYAIRESRIGRVVYGMQAPLTGGVTRWNILADTLLSDTLPEVFAPPPVIVPGFMREQVETAMANKMPRALGIHPGAEYFRRPAAAPHSGTGARPPRPQCAAVADVVAAPPVLRPFRPQVMRGYRHIVGPGSSSDGAPRRRGTRK